MSDKLVKIDPWQEAKDFGIDTELLKDSMNLSYDERAINHQRALENLWLLLEAKDANEKS